MILPALPNQQLLVNFLAGLLVASQSGPLDLLIGRAVFVAVFALLGIWLLVIPGHCLWGDDPAPPWWRNVRFWAVLVAFIQMTVYLVWA